MFLLCCSSGLPDAAGSLGGSTGAGFVEKRETVKECGKQSPACCRLHLHLSEEPGATPLGPVHAASVSSCLWAADFCVFLFVCFLDKNECLQQLTSWWRCLLTLFQAGWTPWIMMTECCSAVCSIRHCIQRPLLCCARKLYIQASELFRRTSWSWLEQKTSF